MITWIREGKNLISNISITVGFSQRFRASTAGADLQSVPSGLLGCNPCLLARSVVISAFIIWHRLQIRASIGPHICYHKAAEIDSLMKAKMIDILEANRILKLIDASKLKEILQPGNLLKLGFSLDDL